MERITGAQRSEVVSAMEQLEEVMAASLPPSPEISEDEASPRGARGQTTSSPKERGGSEPLLPPPLLPSSRRLFPPTPSKPATTPSKSPPNSSLSQQSPSKLNLDSTLDLSQL